jgi:hypothetical protein
LGATFFGATFFGAGFLAGFETFFATIFFAFLGAATFFLVAGFAFFAGFLAIRVSGEYRETPCT